MNIKFLTNLKVFVLYYFPKPIFNIVMKSYIKYKKLRMPEEYRSYGDLNPDKTFFVIRFYHSSVGLACNYIYVLGYMRYAFDCGYIPVIDMENYSTIYSDSEPYNGTNNVWEWFFEQPLDIKSGHRYSLKEVYQSKNVILSDGTMDELFCVDMLPDTMEWQEEMVKLIPFNAWTKEYIGAACENLLGTTLMQTQETRLLGICYRMQSLYNDKAKGHAKYPKINEFRDMVLKKCDDKNIRDIFIMTESEEVIDSFSDIGLNIYATKRTRIMSGSADSLGVDNIREKFKIHPAKSLTEYLAEIYILSKCDAVYGIRSSGLYLAQIWNGGRYNEVEYGDLGII